VLGTGASYSVSPNKADIVTEIKLPTVRFLKGLNHNIPIMGTGTAEWTILDMHGKEATIRTQCYYVPSATIRLFSPQVYHEEEPTSLVRTNHKGIQFGLQTGTILEFPY
jgi:hypothetical protein